MRIEDYIIPLDQFNVSLAQSSKERQEKEQMKQRKAENLARQEFQKQQFFGDKAVRDEKTGLIDPALSQRAMELAQDRETMGMMEGLGIGGTVAPNDADMATNDYRKGLVGAKRTMLPLDVRREVAGTQMQGREDVERIRQEGANQRAQLMASLKEQFADKKNAPEILKGPDGKSLGYFSLGNGRAYKIPGDFDANNLPNLVQAVDALGNVIQHAFWVPGPNGAPKIVHLQPANPMTELLSGVLQQNATGKTNAPAAKPGAPPAGVPKVPLNPKGGLEIPGYKVRVLPPAGQAQTEADQQ